MMHTHSARDVYNPERSDFIMTPPKKNPAAVALGRRGGQAGTKAQNSARKDNAQSAGRPGRVCDDCGEPVRGWHKDSRLDIKCKGQSWHWQKPSEK